MLTKNEITALNLSPTKKDFVQVWNELLEVAGKLSERWDPTSTNESDPGIVILKALTGITDKLNYNIDKNILEAFMPTAAQEDSMRKLCEMLGYSMKYYRSAETSVNIKYYNPENTLTEALLIPKFTVITNSDKDISYFTTNQTEYYISETSPSVTLNCMEGQIVKCESVTDNNIITISQISENNRFYLPEAHIAENGLFIYNVQSAYLGEGNTALVDGYRWEKVDNLNVQARGSRVFKFGYDSYESRPYVEFPEDYSELFNEGLFIYYTRTSGANGNISPRTLTQLEIPSSWTNVAAEDFSVENTFAATSGANLETIKQAYNNFKKTIGTFETLVTCRDYMNKIYSMSDDFGRPLFSNILVTDIRNDLNRAVTICSCDDAGIFYKETPLTTTITKTLKSANSDELVEVLDEIPAISSFDLVLYPFKSYSQIKSNVKDIQEVYDASFKYTPKGIANINNRLEEANIKTLAHNMLAPREDDIVSINNYLRLNAIISTNSKLTNEEGLLLIDTVKIALANAFNLRELDFSEEIPFESIVEVIEKADARIKTVSLNEPALYTTFSIFKGTDFTGNPIIKEYAVASDFLTESAADYSGRFEIKKDSDGTYINGTYDTLEARKIYNKLAVRNILAGRIPLFNYNNTFQSSFSEGAYTVTEDITKAVVEDKSIAVPAEYAPAAIKQTKTPAIWADGSDTYTVSVKENAEDLNNPILTYTRTGLPKLDSAKYKYGDNGFITNINDNNITEIIADCIISPPADASDSSADQRIYDVALEEGEFIKFRAPNLITAKTYPAYVNYHLRLDTATTNSEREAQSATAYTLFELLNNQPSKWEYVYSYFTDKTIGKDAEGKAIPAIKKFTLTRQVKITTREMGKADLTVGPEELELDDSEVETTLDFKAILYRSGCVKICNDGLPTVEGKALTAKPFKLNHSTYCTTNITSGISTIINTQLKGLLDNGTLGEGDYKISYDFEYIPFVTSTFTAWKDFIESQSSWLFGFAPEKDSAGDFLWYLGGTATEIGEKVIADGSSNDGKKLTSLENVTALDTAGSFDSRLHGIYIAEDLGRDAAIGIVYNNEEYELREGEKLYIEYTPSTTSDDGVTETQESQKVIHGPGTIIRPSGFETNLTSSSDLAKTRTTLKNLNFDGVSEAIPMFSLGPNEQIEIRERSKVTLNASSFKSASAVYIYKNFNGCEQLESYPTYQNGQRINNKYTLKDGEYIFYTDQNKAELAYYTSGTEVTLLGGVTLPKLDIISLETIFESGIQSIPWYPIALSDTNGIEFQEYQYVTIAAGDTLKNLYIDSKSIPKEVDATTLDSTNWKKCYDVKYTTTHSDATQKLSDINLVSGDGWEACTGLTLNVSPNKTQTLRKTANTEKGNVQTSVTLLRKSASGGQTDEIRLEAEDANSPLSFKTNLACTSGSGRIELDEVYLNPNNLKSFEVKVIKEATPSIIKTIVGSLAPYSSTELETAIDEETSALSFATLDDAWNRASLNAITPVQFNIMDSPTYERALRLPITLLPNTYGIFSIYIVYSNESDNPKTWIELLPGASQASVTLLNGKANWEANKLILKPGLNCIKVNTANNIYIKSKENTIGTLYYDSLRLVDITPIEALENGNKVYKLTQGLNLKQIGYLDTSYGDYNNTFTSRIRKQLKADYATEAITRIDEREQALDKVIDAEITRLSEYTSKIKVLKDFVKQVKDELETIQKSDDSDIKYRDAEALMALIAEYKAISADLEKEFTLKNALESNKELGDLGKELNELLESLTNIEAVKQELFNRIEETKQKALANIDTFDEMSREDILADFSMFAEDDLTIEQELKLASLGKVNTQYHEQFEQIQAKLAEVASEKEAITELLTSLNKSNYEELILLISELTEKTHSSIVTGLNEAKILSQGAEVDYNILATKLLSVRVQLATEELENIVDLIEESGLKSVYKSLTKYVAELETLLTTRDDTLFNQIDAILTTVEAQTGTAPVETITQGISNLIETAKNNYINKVKTALTKIEVHVTSDAHEYAEALKALANSADIQVKELAEQLKSITESRAIDTASIKSFTTSAVLTGLPFGEELVIALWPAHIKRSFENELNTLCVFIRGAQADDPWAITSNARLNVHLFSKAADIKTFKKLFKEAQNLANEEVQVKKRSERIETIGNFTLTQLAPEVANALQAFIIAQDSDSSADKAAKKSFEARNKVVFSLISKIASASADSVSIADCYQLISDLVIELNKTIEFDTQLAEAAAKYVCPSILLFNEEKYEDDFYDRLVSYITGITGIRQQFLSLSSSNDIHSKLGNILNKLTTDHYYLIDELLESLSSREALQTWLDDKVANLENSLLPAELITVLSTIKDTYDKLKVVGTLKGCDFIQYLQNEELVAAWEVIETTAANETISKWFSSTGKEFTVSNNQWQLDGENVTVNAKKTADGNWKTTSGATIAVYTESDGWTVESDVKNIKLNEDDILNVYLLELLEKAAELGNFTLSSEYDIIRLETQLLDEISTIDKNGEFYYNVPIESYMAIDFNDSEDSLNTLMNPAINYDINNINNAFVISKLDINYLNKGIQIARSSRIS